MEQVLANLAESIPSTIAVIVVVVLFLREQARLQKEWSAQMERLVEAIDKLSIRMTKVERSVSRSSTSTRKKGRNV